MTIRTLSNEALDTALDRAIVADDGPLMDKLFNERARRIAAALADEEDDDTVTVRKLTENQVYVLEDGILRFDSFQEDFPDVRVGKTFLSGPRAAIEEIAEWAEDLNPEDTGTGCVEGSGICEVTEAMEEFGMAQKWRTIYSLQTKLFAALGMHAEANRARQAAARAQRGRL